MRRLPATAHGLALVLAVGALSSSCFTGSDGRAPIADQFYFPTALAISAGRTALYVANSDFDLQYAGGTVQVIDAKALRGKVRPMAEALARQQPGASVCPAASLGVNPDPFLNPGPCSPIAAPPYIKGAVFVGAFASALVLTYDPNGVGARLFSPVRGDPSITFFEVDDDRQADVAAAPTFKLDCNASLETTGFCSDEHRVGRIADRSLRGLQLPSDPLGTAASGDGGAIVTAHQTQDAGSLVVNPWGQQPYLSYFANKLSSGPTELAAIPRARVVDLARQAAAAGNYGFNHRDMFALTFRGAAQIDLLAYFPDSGSVPPRPFLVRSQQIPLSVSSSNVDSRGIAIVSSERRACEAICAGKGDALDCNAACAEQAPHKVYIANRNPASLLIGRIHTVLLREQVTVGMASETRITGVIDTLEVHQTLPLDFGASHVRVGQVVDRDGTLVDRVFALAFDAREIFVIDPLTDALETVVHAGRGPQDVVIDSGSENGEPYSFMYIAHFTDSYLGVADFDLRRPVTYGQIVATLGEPLAPAESR